MKTIFDADEKVTVLSEHKQIRGINIITVKPGDVLIVIGTATFGEVACRFADCAQTPSLHDAFFGLLYIEPNNLKPINS